MVLKDKRLRVAINAQIPGSGIVGGVEQFILGLVSALGRLDDGPEEYVFIVSRSNPDWLAPYLRDRQHTVLAPYTKSGAVKRLLVRFASAGGKLWERVRSPLWRFPALRVPVSNGFYEGLGAAVLHFPYQDFVQCRIPSVYNPHDLQHLHHPEFFSRRAAATRELVYRTGCKQAQAVAMPSQWAKQDIALQYEIPLQKIYAILYGPPTELYETVTPAAVERAIRKFHLPQQFALYPAQTWPHKNHLRLLEALARLRDREHLCVNLVCTGRKGDFWRVIERRARELRLESQVQFLGFVSAAELRAIYQAAQFAVLPSLFEGGGLPLLESFHEGLPIACSDVTSLTEYAGDSARLFDPLDVEGIADTLHAMATNPVLRDELRRRGSERVRSFSWERTAKTYRALYRRIAGAELSNEDNCLLEEC